MKVVYTHRLIFPVMCGTERICQILIVVLPFHLQWLYASGNVRIVQIQETKSITGTH